MFCLDKVYFFGRSLEEYSSMFAIPEDVTNLSILDCPSGPAAFVAEMSKRGAKIKGVDPKYAIRDVNTLRDIGEKDILQIREKFTDPSWTTDVPSSFNLDDFLLEKNRALSTFCEDYDSGLKEGRYVCASLPNLPFENGSFDLVLSSYLLFAYASASEGGVTSISSGQVAFDLAKHIASIEELARVCKKQLQFFPIHNFQDRSSNHPYLEATIARLEELGFACEVQSSSHVADTDKNKRLVATRRTA